MHTDNITARAHINHQGVSKSLRLHKEAWRFLCWAELHLASLRAEHIKGVSNIQGDWLSRETIDPVDWSLKVGVSADHRLFWTPLDGPFPTHLNSQVPRFFSRYLHYGTEATNALISKWPQGLLYAFPPIPILQNVLRKIIGKPVDVIVVQ